MAGLFITFEGIEGSGKSSQLTLLFDELKERGLKVIRVREPGGTGLGERIRPLLLNESTDEMDPVSELLLYEAARAELVAEVIRPALGAGEIVLSDRFTDSTVAYQGYGRGIDLDVVSRANDIATSGLRPDLTVLFDCDVELGLKRAWDRINNKSKESEREDRFEKEAIEFHQKVRKGFLDIAASEPERVKVIDASGSVDEVQASLLAIVEPVIKRT